MGTGAPQKEIEQAARPADHAREATSGQLSEFSDPTLSLINRLHENWHSSDSKLLTARDVKPLFEKYLPEIDLNHDGAVDMIELNRQVASGRVTGEKAELVTVLKEGYESLQQGFFRHFLQSGITKADIADFDRSIATSQRATREISALNANWHYIDKNGNDFISKDELTAASNDTTVGAETRAIFKEMLSHFHDIEAAHNDEWFVESNGISLKDQFDYAIVHKIDRLFSLYKDDLDHADRRVYGAFENPLDAIKPAAIRQNRIGDCVFLASLGSLAAFDPESIQKMISVDNDGHFNVKFPGLKDVINVSPPTDSELLYLQNGREYGTWAAILEKAWGKYCAREDKRRNIPDAEGADAASHSDQVMKALTGNTMEMHSKSRNSDDIISFLNVAKKLHLPVMATTEERDERLSVYFGLADSNDVRDLAKQHAYSVIDFDEKTKMVTMRNPWGNRVNANQRGEPLTAHGADRDGQHDGVFKMSIDDFIKNFDSLYSAA